MQENPINIRSKCFSSSLDFLSDNPIRQRESRSSLNLDAQRRTSDYVRRGQAKKRTKASRKSDRAQVKPKRIKTFFGERYSLRAMLGTLRECSASERPYIGV